MKVAQEATVETGDFANIVRRVTDTLRRRWLSFLLIAASVFAIAVVLILLITPRYTAVTHVRIDPSRTPVGGQTDNSGLSPEAIETEITLLLSDDIARSVVRKLRLANDPEFTKGMPETGLTPNDRETIVASKLASKLDVIRDKLSYVLGIGFTSTDRIKAARVANAVADAYIYAKIGSKADVAGQKARFLREQLEKLGADIAGSQAQIADYRAQAGITGGAAANGVPGQTIVDQQVAPLSTELAQAKSDAAQASAALATASAQVRAGNGEAVSEVLASPVIGQLRAQRAVLLGRVGEIYARYGDKHPETIQVQGLLRDVDVQIKAETNRILSSLASKVASANARANSLQASMDGLAGRQSSNARSAVLANNLETQLTSKRSQYDKLSQSLLETQQASNNSIAQAEIVDTAKPPINPSFPNKPLMLLLGLVVALAAAAGTITVQELMVTGLRTRDEIETRLGVPMLAAIPYDKAANVADLIIDKPTSLFSESFRIARASLLGVRGQDAPQILAITSALPSEGKTTTALALARTLAINGQSTLLLDCDVRRALLRTTVRNQVDAPGIVEVLHGTATVDQAITRGDVEKLDHMLVRERYFSSENLFGDGKMQQLLTALRSRYEIVVMDLPPLIGLADARFLSAMADSVAMVLRWDATPGGAATAAMDSLMQDEAKVSGVILTMVEAGAEAIGGLYYSKKYTNYYQDR